jgi:hypothetical protein
MSGVASTNKRKRSLPLRFRDGVLNDDGDDDEEQMLHKYGGGDDISVDDSGDEVLLLSPVVQTESRWSNWRVGAKDLDLKSMLFSLFRRFSAAAPIVPHTIVNIVSRAARCDNVLHVSAWELHFELKLNTMLHMQAPLERAFYQYRRDGDLDAWARCVGTVVPAADMQRVLHNAYDRMGILYVFAILLHSGHLARCLSNSSIEERDEMVKDVNMVAQKICDARGNTPHSEDECKAIEYVCSRFQLA